MLRLIAARPSGRSASALQPLAARAMQGQHDRQLLKTGGIVGERGFNQSASAALPRQAFKGGNSQQSSHEYKKARTVLASAFNQPGNPDPPFRDLHSSSAQVPFFDDVCFQNNITQGVRSICEAQPSLSPVLRHKIVGPISQSIFLWGFSHLLSVVKAVVVTENGVAHPWSGLYDRQTVNSQAHRELQNEGVRLLCCAVFADNLEVLVSEAAVAYLPCVYLDVPLSARQGSWQSPEAGYLERFGLPPPHNYAVISLRIGPSFSTAVVEGVTAMASRSGRGDGSAGDPFGGSGFSTPPSGAPFPATVSVPSQLHSSMGC